MHKAGYTGNIVVNSKKKDDYNKDDYNKEIWMKPSDSFIISANADCLPIRCEILGRRVGV